MLLVTHDLAEAAFFAHELVLLRDGRLVQRGTLDDLVARAGRPVRRALRPRATGARAAAGSGAVIAAPLAAALALAASSPAVTVGSKQFGESLVLGELATQLAREAGARAVHRAALGGTRVVWEALLRGEVDLYPEYTGTIAREILGGAVAADDVPALRAALAARGVGMTSGARVRGHLRARDAALARRASSGSARVSDLAASPAAAARVHERVHGPR